MKLTLANKSVRLFLRLRGRYTAVPFILSLPYIVSLTWLVLKGQVWIALLMLTPLLMIFAIVTTSLILGYLEFRE